jgi:hypothetical protein
MEKQANLLSVLCFCCATQLQYAPFTLKSLSDIISEHSSTTVSNKIVTLANAAALHVIAPAGNEKAMKILLNHFGTGIYAVYLEPAIAYARKIYIEHTRKKVSDTDIRRMWLDRIKYDPTEITQRLTKWSQDLYRQTLYPQPEQIEEESNYNFNNVAQKTFQIMTIDPMNRSPESIKIRYKRFLNEHELALVQHLALVLSDFRIMKPKKKEEAPVEAVPEEQGWWNEIAYKGNVPAWAKQPAKDPNDFLAFQVKSIDPYFFMK